MNKPNLFKQSLVPISPKHRIWKIIISLSALFPMYHGKTLLLDEEKGTVYMVGSDDQPFDVGHYDAAKEDYCPWSFKNPECLKSI